MIQNRGYGDYHLNFGWTKHTSSYKIFFYQVKVALKGNVGEYCTKLGTTVVLQLKPGIFGFVLHSGNDYFSIINEFAWSFEFLCQE